MGGLSFSQAEDAKDACEDGIHNCHENAMCEPGEDLKSFKCTCESGYVGDGTTCAGEKKTKIIDIEEKTKKTLKILNFIKNVLKEKGLQKYA